MRIKRRLLSSISISLVFAVGSISGVVGGFLNVENNINTLFQIIIILISFLILKSFNKKPAARTGRLASELLLIFVLISIITTLIAQQSGNRLDAEDMWRHAIQAYCMVFAFWGCSAWASTAFETRPIDIGFLLLSLTCSASVLLDAAAITSFESYGSRYFGFMGDSGAWLLSFSVVYFVVRKVFNVPLILAIVALLNTQSIGATAVCIFALLLYFFLANNVEHRLNKLVTALMFIFVFIFAQKIFLQSIDRMQSIDLLSNDRFQTNAYTFSTFQENPLWGGGYNIHRYRYLSNNITNEFEGLELWGTPTSTHLQVLADTGLVGFSAWAGFVILICLICLQTIRFTFNQKQPSALVALSVWLLPFLLLNHSAAWMLPGSKVGIIVFAATGIVAGATRHSRRFVFSREHR